ncbi:proteinase [Mangrovactinospora gilvigrisea]|uniref:Proteinase n=1 Tax=Mangrovactinospora gilvigrisea TaxID=1428644 RepID=A0A1J7BC99_9ACTN|nr:alpha/beta hydrolase [Mangrovactinospora gilvigrisea]OIV36319.1 proteinase [Mangrovactinospora gilvigrisea]
MVGSPARVGASSRRLAAVLGLAGLLVAGCSGGSSGGSAATSGGGSAHSASGDAHGAGTPLPAATPAALARYYNQHPAWKSCAGGFQCARIKVPMDYGDPSKGDIGLAISRHAATGHTKLLGSLLVNPGGPGGSGLEYARYAELGYPKAVTSRYAVVGFDPRGVGTSDPVHCLTDKQMDTYTETDPTPRTAAEVNRLEQEMKVFADGCKQRSGKELPYVSTVDAARDMDVIRAVVGDRKLSYLGKSYGTFLGATYAELFPERTGRLVLDGALDPSISPEESNRLQAGGFQVAFDAFAKWCVTKGNCPLGGSAKGAGPRLTALFDRTERHPLPTHGLGGRRVDSALATTGVLSAMYAQQEWPLLKSALDQAAHGDGTGLLTLSDEYYERDDKGRYSNLMYANSAVNCLDAPSAAMNADQVRKQLPSYEKTSPQFGENLAWAGLNCAYWPVKPTGRPHRITAAGSAPIVVVGTTRDPATPYGWAKALAKQLANGHLLSYNGDGHTAYARGSACVDRNVNAFLLSGTVPKAGTMC